MAGKGRKRPKLAAELAASHIQQPHGGALLSGGVPGHDGQNAGRPTSELRARLRGSFSDRLPVLEEIADDPNAVPRDRIRAVDILGKYSMGQSSAVDTELVREKLSATIDVVRNTLPEDEAVALITRLKGIWTR